MASPTLETCTATQQAKAELLAALDHKESIPRNIGVCLARYRSECDKEIMNHQEIMNHHEPATDHDAERALWDSHVKVHKRFQTVLRMYDREQKHVERRKIAKSYLNFIKDSQSYYRGFIQRLVSKYGGIPELNAIASNLSLEKLTAVSTLKLSGKLCHAVLLSCHQTLIHLGDLSRYREEVLAKGECNWGPAIGYYDLAGAIYPTSGASHHQLAVIARHGGCHLRVTYHLYRALATEQPFPTARDNLELEMKKIETAQSKGKLVSEAKTANGQSPEKVASGLFMLLHSRLYKGSGVSEEELENEILTQLATDLKERPMPGIVNKLVLVNIAAQYFASVRSQDEPHAIEYMRAFDSFLQFNVKTLITLLHSLKYELTQPTNDVNSSGSAQFRITALTRRILPALRQYSSWLTCNINVLIGYTDQCGLGDLIKVFFELYAGTMTLLASTFNPDSLPLIEYLLEEDEDTIGFKPLDEHDRSRYFEQSSGTLRQKFHTHGVERHHPNVEMLGRIRDLLADAVALVMRNEVPIDLSGGSAFTFRCDNVASEHTSKSNDREAAASITGNQDGRAPTNGKPQFDAMAFLEEHISRASSSSASMADTTMENMVDNLVGCSKIPNGINPQPTQAAPYSPRPRLSTHGYTYNPPPAPLPDYGPIGTPPRRSSNNNTTDFGPIGTPPKATGNDTSYGIIGTPTAQELARRLSARSSMETSPHPRLPNIYQSPFAPQADDAGSLPHPSQRNTQQGFPQGTQANGHHVIESSFCSVPDPSSIGNYSPHCIPAYVTHSPRNQPNIWTHERGAAVRHRLSWGMNGGNGNMWDDGSQFVSSNLLSGSTWNGNGGSHQEAIMQTPPNGQGGA